MGQVTRGHEASFSIPVGNFIQVRLLLCGAVSFAGHREVVTGGPGRVDDGGVWWALARRRALNDVRDIVAIWGVSSMAPGLKLIILHL